MRVHLVNPSDVSFGVAIITPRWLYVLAAATPPTWGDPILTDETLEATTRLMRRATFGIGFHGQSFAATRLAGSHASKGHSLATADHPPSTGGPTSWACAAVVVATGIRRGPRF